MKRPIPRWRARLLWVRWNAGLSGSEQRRLLRGLGPRPNRRARLGRRLDEAAAEVARLEASAADLTAALAETEAGLIRVRRERDEAIAAGAERAAHLANLLAEVRQEHERSRAEVGDLRFWRMKLLTAAVDRRGGGYRTNINDEQCEHGSLAEAIRAICAAAGTEPPEALNDPATLKLLEELTGP